MYAHQLATTVLPLRMPERIHKLAVLGYESAELARAMWQFKAVTSLLFGANPLYHNMVHLLF